MKNNLIKLRALEIQDIELLYQWENNPEIWTLSHTQKPFSKSTLEKFIQNDHLDIYEQKQIRLMIEEKTTNRAIGTIDLFDFNPQHKRAGIGILISNKNDRQKGYASNALELLLEYCKNTLHLHQIYCNILKENKISIGLFEKFSFELIGNKKEWILENGFWKDELLFQLILN